MQPATASQVSGITHMLSSGVFVHAPVAESQVSTVQVTPSSQSTGVPSMQAPPTQVSMPLQASPSSQSAGLLQPAWSTQ